MKQMADEHDRLREEIERLTRERDRAVEAVAREGRHARRIEIERLRTALEWYANTSEAPKRALEALRDAPETTAQQAMREFEDGPGPISPESKKESP